MYWNPTVAVTLHSVTGWIVTLDVLKSWSINWPKG